MATTRSELEELFSLRFFQRILLNDGETKIALKMVATLKTLLFILVWILLFFDLSQSIVFQLRHVIFRSINCWHFNQLLDDKIPTVEQSTHIGCQTDVLEIACNKLLFIEFAKITAVALRHQTFLRTSQRFLLYFHSNRRFNRTPKFLLTPHMRTLAHSRKRSALQTLSSAYHSLVVPLAMSSFFFNGESKHIIKSTYQKQRSNIH